jgi:hypothetical protein
MKNGFNRRTARFTYCAFLALTLSSCSCPALAQDPPPPAPLPPANSQATTPQKQPLPAAPSALAAKPQRECEEPQPTFTGVEYTGPLKKLAAHIVGKPEIRTVTLPRDRSGKRVCSLPVKKKFMLFARDTFEPGTFVFAAFDAGLSQAQNNDPTFGQGGEGYGRRYGAAFADQVSGKFFGTFFYPTILREDPRYFRLGYGTKTRRLFHAMNHSFVTRTDNGGRTFNFSEWLAKSSTTALGNLYHPGNHRGFQPAARGVAYSVSIDMGFDVLREFWPEVSKHLRLPFVVIHTDPQK